MREQPEWRLRGWLSGCASSWPRCGMLRAGSSAPPRSASPLCKPTCSPWLPAWYAPLAAAFSKEAYKHRLPFMILALAMLRVIDKWTRICMALIAHARASVMRAGPCHRRSAAQS